MTGSDTVTVQFAATQAAVTVYDPTVGMDPIRTERSVPSLRLTLSDHPLVLRVSGR